MERVRKWLDRLMVALLSIAAVLGSASAVLATVNALCRKILSTSFPWAEELITYLVVVAVFLAIPFLEWKSKQLTVDILGNSLKNKKVRKGFQVFSAAIVIVLCFIIVRYGTESTITAYETNMRTYVLLWPRSIFFGIGVISFILTIIASIGTIFLGNEKGGDVA
ncbi:MAG: TRAP transporter small permease [Eubacterium sp.]|jgi:TRAP-type C4-dicarboxylate transport system, small permease component|nr:TRAP transporter small permease [Eubacterium sp.]